MSYADVINDRNTSKTKTVNQVHPPLPKKKSVDKQGNRRRRIYVKSGTATMLLCKGLTENGCKALIDRLKTWANQLGTKIECEFLIV